MAKLNHHRPAFTKRATERIFDDPLLYKPKKNSGKVRKNLARFKPQRADYPTYSAYLAAHKAWRSWRKTAPASA